MLDGYKMMLTALLAFIIALCTVITQYINGQTVDVEILITALVALAMIFLRSGIKKDLNGGK